MTASAIRAQFKYVKNRFDLLCLLNNIKADEFGPDYPFTIDQLNYFCNSKRATKHYRSFVIPKRSGGQRTIYAPTRMLKSLLRCTNIFLQAICKPSKAAMGFCCGKSIVDNASIHCGKLYVFNSDLQNFFPSISKNRVRASLECVDGMEANIADALANLCCIHDSNEARDYLPQGSPSSPVITNIVCRQLDAKLILLSKRYRCRYTRYADDITFSGNRSIYSPTGIFMREFRRIIEGNGFTINEGKTRCQKRGSTQEVTGLIVGEKVNVTKKYIHDLRCILHIWEHYGISDASTKYFLSHSAEHSSDLNRPSLIATVRGKLNYLRMVKGEDDSTYVKLANRFSTLLTLIKSNTIRDVEFIASTKIKHFEEIHSCRITFKSTEETYPTYDGEIFFIDHDIFDEDFYEPLPISISFSINGTHYQAYMSRHCYEQLEDKGIDIDSLDDAWIRDKLCISMCIDHRFKKEKKFWLITRKYPKGAISTKNVLKEIAVS